MRETTPGTAEGVLREGGGGGEREREKTREKGYVYVAQIDVCLWLNKGSQLRNVLGDEEQTRHIYVDPMVQKFLYEKLWMYRIWMCSICVLIIQKFL